MEYLKMLLEYCSLGYDVYFTQLYGKDAITMTKRYSYKAERPLHCQQMFDHEKIDLERLRSCLDFMYTDIQEQEESKKYYEIDKS
jgi:hypothetical protein